MDFSQSQDLLQKASLVRSDIRTEIYALKQKLDDIQREKEKLSRGGDRGSLQGLAAQEDQLKSSIKEKTSQLAKAASAEKRKLKDFLPFTDPRTNLSKLDDGFPILLMPLRLETRFKEVKARTSIGTKQQLWIRVFPDDIAIDSFEPALSKDELRSAISYWQSIWIAANSDAGKRGAWRSLVASHGSGRGWWITQTYMPVNSTEQPTAKADDEVILAIGTETPLTGEEASRVLVFWESVWRATDNAQTQQQAKEDLIDRFGADRTEELITQYVPVNLSDLPPAGKDRSNTKVTVEYIVFPDSNTLSLRSQSWTQPATVKVLPERLVVQGYYGGNLEINEIGEPIASPLAVGPDPSAENGADIRPNGEELGVSDSIKWLIDFDDAVSNGMGFKIDLTAEQARRGFDRLLVLGVCMSADENKGEQLLEELLNHHHQSRKGLSILLQGTPTNNTDQAASGYHWQEDSDISYDHYFNSTVLDNDGPAWTKRTDGQWLTECLGIDGNKFKNIENFTATEHTDAKAMNIALWPSTLGYFMESMMAPVFDDATIRQTRDFFTHNITGRGVLPAIRIGSQPYGILPATAFSRMNWLGRIDKNTTRTAASVVGQKPFLLQLYNVLLEIDKTWSDLRNRVSHISTPGDAHQVLLDIIGLHPNSAEVYARYAQSLEHLHNYYNMVGIPLIGSLFTPEKYIESGLKSLKEFGYLAEPGKATPDILTKFFFDDANRLTGKLIDDMPLSEKDLLRDQHGDENYLEWLIEAARKSHDTLRRQEGFDGGTPPTALLYLMLHHALDLCYINSSLQMHLVHGLMTAGAVAAAKIEPRFIHIEQNGDKGSRWQHIYKTETAITGNATTLLSDYIPTRLGNSAETGELNETLEAIDHLKSRATAKLERALIEHLDTCTYRYDAWMLGLVNHQLQLMRQIGDDKSTPTKGIYLGAYGWLEEVTPKESKVTSKQLDGELKMKFQSQTDAPLQTDDSNAGYILAPSLNHAVTAAVLRNGFISNRTSPSAKPFAVNLSSERVRLALNVVEGIRAGQSLAALLGYELERGLHDRHDAEVDEFIFDLRLAFPLVANQMQSTKTDQAESIEQIEARNVINGLALIEQVENSDKSTYPFGAELPSATQAQQDAINAEVRRIMDINDAVADLAMAEGVHQVVQGNYDRASAVLDSYSKGQLPPMPDVIQTPRNGITITHRVGLQLKTGIPPSDPSNTSPRSKAEPALNDWLAGVLPAPNDIVCVVKISDRARESEEVVSMEDLELQPIDLLYLANTANEPSMSALNDIIVHYVINNFSPLPDAAISILYSCAVANKVTLFELASLIDSLRVILLRSRPLNRGDVRPASEVKKSEEVELLLDPQRITTLQKGLNDIVAPSAPAVSPFETFLDDITPLITAKDIDGLIADLDTFIDDLGSVLSAVGRYGLPQTGTGFVYDWRRRTFAALIAKVEALVARLEQNLTDYATLMGQYPGLATPEEKNPLLQKAERLIAATNTLISPPDDYHDQLENVERPAFEEQLGRIRDLLDLVTISDLFEQIAAEQTTLRDFDLVGIDITAERNQVLIFAEDMRLAVENLQKDLANRLNDVDAKMTEYEATVSPGKKIQLISDAAKKLLHEDFKLIPEFSLNDAQVKEWNTALAGSSNILRYLRTEKKLDFPVDNWLYGVARVREKLHHIENAIFFVEGFARSPLELRVIQLPYRPLDYWLAMEYPDEIAETNQPFTINEDKLLYTSIYADGFDRTQSRCGLMLDEWTEVIPVPETTIGLTFNFDQPNTEPPQTLLLATPSDFRGEWQWHDLVDTLHETLDMAKKRAVEPDMVDTTLLGRFLPALVSVVTAYPITSALNLAINNKYFIKEAANG
jgi:hypothetical protein